MNNTVSNRQILFMLFMVIVEGTVVGLPQTMAQTAKTGAWLSIMIAAAGFGLIATAYAVLGNAFQGKTLAEYSVQLVGKFGSMCLSAIFILYFLTYTAYYARSTAEFIKTDFMNKTPIWAIVFVMFAITVYSTLKGIFNLGRIAEFFGVFIFITAFFIQNSILIQGDLYNLRPLFNTSMIGDYLSALPALVVPFLGFEVISVIPFSKQNGKRSVLYVFLDLLVMGVFIATIVLSTYAILGVEDTQNYQDALIVSIRRVDMAFLQFFKRLDVLFLVAWLFGVFSGVTLMKYAVTVYAEKLFPKVSRRWIVLCANIVVFILAILPQNYNQLIDIYGGIMQYAAILPAFVIPLVLLFIAKVKKYV